MKARRLMLVLFVATISMVMVLSLSACGGDESPSDEPAVDDSARVADQVGEIDACGIVTQQVATDLFGQPAVQDEGTPIIDPNVLGECIWSWDTETSNQLLQFRVWNSDEYFMPPADSQQLAVGDQGYIRFNEVGGIDIGWLQGDNFVELSYFNVGPDVPEMASKVEPMKDMATQVSGQL